MWYTFVQSNSKPRHMHGRVICCTVTSCSPSNVKVCFRIAWHYHREERLSTASVAVHNRLAQTTSLSCFQVKIINGWCQLYRTHSVFGSVLVQRERERESIGVLAWWCISFPLVPTDGSECLLLSHQTTNQIHSLTDIEKVHSFAYNVLFSPLQQKLSCLTARWEGVKMRKRRRRMMFFFSGMIYWY